MNVKGAQDFVSRMLDFCKKNSIYGELVPTDSIFELDISPEDIEYIKKFVGNNPIVERPKNPRYKKSVDFSGNKFLNLSYAEPEGFEWKDQIFMPTWMLTAMILTRVIRDLGARSVFDFGAGDGRVQYCASSMGLRSYGMEYSKELIDVQKKITEKTGVKLGPIQGDVLKERDYGQYHLKKPAFLISLVGKVGRITFDGLKNSLEKYTPNLLDESFFVTIRGDENFLRRPILDVDKSLSKIYNLELPTYWDRKTNYQISKLNL